MMNAIDYSNLAHELLSEYNDADNPGLLRQKIAEAFADVATKAIADEREAKWQPIETAPKTGETVLIGHGNSVWEDEWDILFRGWFRTLEGGDHEGEAPTVWQPLPLPPAIRRDDTADTQTEGEVA